MPCRNWGTLHWLGHQSQIFKSTVLRLWVVGSYVTSLGQSHVGHHRIIDFPSYDVLGDHVLLTPWLFLLWRSDLLVCNYQHLIWALPLLCIGMMFPIFQVQGSCPSLSDLWKMTLWGDEMTSAISFGILVWILLGPGAFWGFSLVSFFLTNSAVMFTSESGEAHFIVSSNGISSILSWVNTLEK